MSHGPSGDDECEINLIPMIDIVIQLITFFLMMTNFEAANVDERVRLPLADLAAPTATNVEDILVVNVDRDGHVTSQGQALAGAIEIRTYLNREAEATRQREDGSPSQTTVMVRADKAADYGAVQQVMKMCQEVGFRRFALRSNKGISSRP